MTRIPTRTFFLYALILIEGYSILAIELLAIRLLVPFVGSSVEIVATLVAAVLMPLAIGYYKGGTYQKIRQRSHTFTIRKKLIQNLITSSLILSIGLSYSLLIVFFTLLSRIGITYGLLQTAIYGLCFIVYPVFLLGQTIPLISHYFSHKKLSEMAGKMLFCSTFGSFLGSLFSTLFLMAVIGVHNTVIVTISLLLLPLLFLCKRQWDINYGLALVALGITILFNHDGAIRKLGIVENNNYSTSYILPVKNEDARILDINHSHASKYSPDFELRFSYIKYIENTFLKPYQQDNQAPRSILVIGAGGCVLGVDDDYNHYTFIDIDAELKNIAEKYLLEQPLGTNKEFVTASARLFFRQNTKKYDLIVLDAYSNINAIPPELITQEFFTQIKQALSPNGIMVANIIASPTFNDRYTIRIDQTLRSVFPNMNRQTVEPYKALTANGFNYMNIIYSYFHALEAEGVYRDNKNTYFLDQKTQ